MTRSSEMPAASATPVLKLDRKPSMSRLASSKLAGMRTLTSTTDARALLGDTEGLGVGEGEGLVPDTAVVTVVVVVGVVVAGVGLGVGVGVGVGVGRGVGAGQFEKAQASDSTKGWHSPPRVRMRVAAPHVGVHGPQGCQVPHCREDAELGQASTPQASESTVELHPDPERERERVPPSQLALQADQSLHTPQLGGGGAGTGHAVWLQAPDSVKDWQAPVRDLERAPPPQLAEHVPHCVQSSQMHCVTKQESDSENGAQPPPRDRMRVPVPQVAEHEPQFAHVPQLGGGGGGGGGGGVGVGVGVGLGLGIMGGGGEGLDQPQAARAKGCPRSSAIILEPPSMTSMPAMADKTAPCEREGMAADLPALVAKPAELLRSCYA